MSTEMKYITPTLEFDAKVVVLKAILDAHRAAKFAAASWQEGLDMMAERGYDNSVLREHVEMRKLYDKEAAALWKAKNIIEKYY